MFNRTVMALVGAALISSAGSMAHAQTTKKTTDFSVRSETSALASPQAAKALKFDARKGRWGSRSTCRNRMAATGSGTMFRRAPISV